MLHRKTSNGLICITQPTHAWVAGQLARAWGNDAFGQFVPWEEVCLGAEQHDIGWQRWEANPTLNLETGYPHSFTEIPTAVSVDIWTRAKEVAMPLGRYATLLISLHGTGIFQRFTGWQKSVEATQQVQHYLQQEEQFQQQLIQILQADPYYRLHAHPDTIARNRQLVATWDWLSLMLCMGVKEARPVERVPATTAEVTLTLQPIDIDLTQITVDPWPFRSASVSLILEGQVLSQPFTEEAAMRQALTQADWVTLPITLLPQASSKTSIS